MNRSFAFHQIHNQICKVLHRVCLRLKRSGGYYREPEEVLPMQLSGEIVLQEGKFCSAKSNPSLTRIRWQDFPTYLYQCLRLPSLHQHFCQALFLDW